MVNWKPHHLKCHWKTCVFYHFCVSLADVVSSARLLFTFPYYTGRTHRSCLYSEALYELLDRGLDDATVLHKMKVSLAQIQKLLIFWDGNVLFSQFQQVFIALSNGCFRIISRTETLMLVDRTSNLASPSTECFSFLKGLQLLFDCSPLFIFQGRSWKFIHPDWPRVFKN